MNTRTPSVKVSETKARGAVIVTRVSTGEQAKHGTSLETQLELCRLKAAGLGLPIIAEYEDAARSGALLKYRAGMMSAVGDIEAGRADTLVTMDLDRYSRDVEHQWSIKKAIEAAGGRLVFCDMEFEATPEGDLNFTIQGGFKQYERHSIRRRTMRGKRKRAEQGQQPVRTTSPYGYHIPTNKDVLQGKYAFEQIGKYLLDEATAPTARRIWMAYHDRTHSLPSLARELNEEGIPSPGGRLWQATTLHNLLSNPVYKGQPVSGRWEAYTDEDRIGRPHPINGLPITRPNAQRPAPPEKWIVLSAPPLVSEEVWDAVQARLEENRARQGGNPRRMRMLSGRVYCPHCGAKAIISTSMCRGKRYHYYICREYQVAAGQLGVRKCVGDVYPIADMEAATVRALSEASEKPEAVAGAVAAHQQAQPESAATVAKMRGELAELDAVLRQIAEEETAAVQAQIAGLRAGASPEAYAKVFAVIAMRRKETQERRDVLAQAIARVPGAKPTKGRPNLPEIKASALANVCEALASPTVEGAEKRHLLGRVVDRVVCGKGGAEVWFAPGAFGANIQQTLQRSFTASSNSVEQRSIRPFCPAGMCASSGREEQKS